jgi:hypothetical protein
MRIAIFREEDLVGYDPEHPLFHLPMESVKMSGIVIVTNRQKQTFDIVKNRYDIDGQSHRLGLPLLKMFDYINVFLY